MLVVGWTVVLGRDGQVGVTVQVADGRRHKSRRPRDAGVQSGSLECGGFCDSVNQQIDCFLAFG